MLVISINLPIYLMAFEQLLFPADIKSTCGLAIPLLNSVLLQSAVK